jgi:hypothetical protein
LTARKTSATRQTKAEIIGQDQAAAEEELPYDKSKATGKLAAALVTGEI